jgi:transcriptional regulator with GAF, ATPase, and Fis domain
VVETACRCCRGSSILGTWAPRQKASTYSCGSVAQNDRHAGAIAVLGASALQTARELEGVRVKANLFEEVLERNSGIVGESAAMKRLLSMVDRVGPQDTTGKRD